MLNGPISLDDAKLHLRIDSADRDSAIAGLIQAAAREIETIYGLVAVQREQAFSLDCFPREVRVPLIPAKADSIAITYVDRAGVVQDFEDFRTFVRHDWMWITPNVGSYWPAVANVAGAITLSATVGYINPDADLDAQPAMVPADVQQAARILVEHLYMGGNGPVPVAVDMLIDHYRFRRV